MNYEITSGANPRIKRLARLASRRHRDDEGVFLVEGSRLVTRAMEAGLAPVEAYGDGSVEVPGLEMTTVAPEVLDRVSYRKRSAGLVVVFQQFSLTLDDLAPGHPALVLVVEDLEKPGNLGAILRTAVAAGADAVVTVPDGIDHFNPNVIRSSTGACFAVPTVSAGFDDMTPWLGDNGVILVAADPAGSTVVWDADLTVPVALMVGAEDAGLSSGARRAADLLLRIPMAGSVDSLNASVAMAVLAFEAVRQRGP